jgi:hypothetical protein
MRTALAFIAMALSVPLLVLNWIAVFVGGIWLLFLGDWGALGIGVVVFIVGTFFLSVVMSVALVFALPAERLHAISPILSAPFLAAGFIFTFVVITAWCVGISYVITERPHTNVWPYILWAYAVATAPLTTMARGELTDNPAAGGTLMWLSAVQFGALGILVSVLVGNGYQTPFGMAVFFIPAALLGMAISGLVSFAAKN